MAIARRRITTQEYDPSQDYAQPANDMSPVRMPDQPPSPSPGVSEPPNYSQPTNPAAPTTPNGPQVGPNGTEVGRSYYNLPGFDTTKLNDVNYGSPKYSFGRWIENTGSAPTTASLQRFVSENPDWELNGSDEIRQKGAANWEDVIKGVGDPNAEWNWLDVPGMGANSGPGASAPSAASPMSGSYSGAAGSAGGANSGGNFGNDPFSKLITGKLSELISNNGYGAPDTEALNLENVRQAADRARTAEYQGVMSQLANRGLLPENTPGGQGGLALDALGRIERNDISPLFSGAVRDYEINRANNANSTLNNTLSMATQRQGVLGNMALQSLAQNTAFNEFVANFGLNRDRVLYELANGQNSQLIDLLNEWLGGARTSAGGYV